MPGDEILAVNEDGRLAWSQVTVLRNSDWQLQAAAPYLRMTTVAGQVVTTTPNHMLYTAPSSHAFNLTVAPSATVNATVATTFADRIPIVARDVKVGDRVFVHLPGAAAVMTSPVMSIEDVTETSAFNVQTLRGNVVVDGVAATQYGAAAHFPAWAAKDVERMKLTADARMRVVYRMFPSAMRRLHAWRLLTPLYNAVGTLGREADKLAHGKGQVHRAFGSVASFLLNRLPATIEAALSRDPTFPGVPHLDDGGDHMTAGECAAGAVPPHLAVAAEHMVTSGVLSV